MRRSLNGGKLASNPKVRLGSIWVISRQKRTRQGHTMTLRGGFEVTRRMVDAQAEVVNDTGEQA
jgi:hypothetical protein